MAAQDGHLHPEELQKFDHDAYMLGWGVATFDGLYTLQSLVRTKTTGADGGFNLGRLSDAKLDALVDAMKTETDVKKRDGMLREALVATRDNYYYVPLHHQLAPGDEAQRQHGAQSRHRPGRASRASTDGRGSRRWPPR